MIMKRFVIVTVVIMGLAACTHSNSYPKFQYDEINAIHVTKQADGTYIATAPKCTVDSPSLLGAKNIPGPAFGCATQANLAAMIANPADLVDPQIPSTHAADRSTLIQQHHNQGKVIPLTSTGNSSSILSPTQK